VIAPAPHGHRTGDAGAICTRSGDPVAKLVLKQRSAASVVESKGQVHIHGHGTAHTVNYANDMRVWATHRHEVENDYASSLRCRKGRFQDQGMRPILPLNFCRTRGRNSPTAIFFSSEKSSEAGGRIKSRRAKPFSLQLWANLRRGRVAGGIAISALVFGLVIASGSQRKMKSQKVS